MIFNDKSSYEGMWENGKKHGQGEQKDINLKTLYAGMWINMWMNGKYHGKGKAQWADGKIYTGDFMDGKM